MISKTQFAKRIEKKQNSELVETLFACKKNDNWLEIGKILSGSSRKRPAINLDQINKECKEGDIVVVPGKVLSQGDIDKKVRIAALSFSETAKEKLLNSKCEVVSIIEEIKKNPKAQGIRIVK